MYFAFSLSDRREYLQTPNGQTTKSLMQHENKVKRNVEQMQCSGGVLVVHWATLYSF